MITKVIYIPEVGIDYVPLNCWRVPESVYYMNIPQYKDGVDSDFTESIENNIEVCNHTFQECYGDVTIRGRWRWAFFVCEHGDEPIVCVQDAKYVLY